MMKHVAAGETVPREKAIPFRKILIANRGEIACRIHPHAATSSASHRSPSITASRPAPAVRMADEAIEITGDTPVAAHLDGTQIIAAAPSAGADAIHPGYGFLSENAGFARAVAAAGLTFVGPDARDHRTDGRQDPARDFRRSARLSGGAVGDRRRRSRRLRSRSAQGSAFRC